VTRIFRGHESTDCNLDFFNCLGIFGKCDLFRDRHSYYPPRTKIVLKRGDNAQRAVHAAFRPDAFLKSLKEFLARQHARCTRSLA